MCTGPFKLDSLEARQRARRPCATTPTGTRALKPKVAVIAFKGVPDDASLTSGLLTNEINGNYPQPLTTLDQLKASRT